MSIVLIALIVLLAVSLLTSFKELSRKRSGQDHNFDQGVKAAFVTVVGLVAIYFGLKILPMVAAVATIVLLFSTLQARR